MTPEDLKKIADLLAGQDFSVPWWSYVLILIFSGAGSFFAPYLKRKGANLATQEDIGKITDEVEAVRLSYTKESHRFQVAASGLFAKQAEAIEGIYHLIVDTEEAFKRFVDFTEGEGAESKDALRQDAGRLLYNFLVKYKKNRIYFSKGVCDKLASFADSIYTASLPFSIALTMKDNGETIKDFTDIWVRTNTDFMEKIPRVRESIEDEFRRLLGVQDIAEE